uniref:(northern house mosquito) hypothetical protein n=1 Tax=Culex pipiens TaxID=7175 RepID=A0A8D8C5L4_CULPI
MRMLRPELAAIWWCSSVGRMVEREAELSCNPGSQTKRDCFSLLVKITDCSSFSANFLAARTRSVDRATLALYSWQLYVSLLWLGFVAASSWTAGDVQTGCALIGSERSSSFTSSASAGCSKRASSSFTA